jgi:hypothetical protein
MNIGSALEFSSARQKKCPWSGMMTWRPIAYPWRLCALRHFATSIAATSSDARIARRLKAHVLMKQIGQSIQTRSSRCRSFCTGGFVAGIE